MCEKLCRNNCHGWDHSKKVYVFHSHDSFIHFVSCHFILLYIGSSNFSSVGHFVPSFLSFMHSFNSFYACASFHSFHRFHALYSCHPFDSFTRSFQFIYISLYISLIQFIYIISVHHFMSGFVVFISFYWFTRSFVFLFMKWLLFSRVSWLHSLFPFSLSHIMSCPFAFVHFVSFVPLNHAMLCIHMIHM